MRPRSAGRRLALQYLFMADMNRFSDVETPSDFFHSQRMAAKEHASGEEAMFDMDDPHRDEAEAFACELIRAVERERDVIDAIIENAARNWSIARMGAIERNVIRIAAAELRAGVSPRGVILDEAVELAKRFGDKESGAFVNGIADRLEVDAAPGASREPAP